VTPDQIAQALAQVAAKWTADGRADEVGEALRRLRDEFVALATDAPVVDATKL
jgi:hypothetical protein